MSYLNHKKFILVKEEINHHRLGCSVPHFIEYIENQPLRVTWETSDQIGFKDTSGEEYTLNKNEVINAREAVRA